MTGIEILSVDLLRSAQPLVEQFRQLSRQLGLGLGWHYPLDLSWTALQLDQNKNPRVLDAGAGTGMMQWWLADQGAEVISVDRMSRRNLPLRFRQRYQIEGWRDEDLVPLRPGVRGFLPPLSPDRWHAYPQKLSSSIRRWRLKPNAAGSSGRILIYNQDISSMADIPDDTIDFIVSISSLEHNSPDALRECVTELMRVLRPGGKLTATLAAAKERDWFHEPSGGWCYTEATLRDIFDLPPDCRSNYHIHDRLLDELRTCAELRDNLADFYFKNGNNGMPWGHWEPQYQPVGVVKTKPT